MADGLILDNLGEDTPTDCVFVFFVGTCWDTQGDIDVDFVEGGLVETRWLLSFANDIFDALAPIESELLNPFDCAGEDQLGDAVASLERIVTDRHHFVDGSVIVLRVSILRLGAVGGNHIGNSELSTRLAIAFPRILLGIRKTDLYGGAILTASSEDGKIESIVADVFGKIIILCPNKQRQQR